MSLKPLPSQVQVGGSISQIRLVDQPTLDDGTKAAGTFDAEQARIEIKRGMAREAQYLTLCHEMFHQAVDSGDHDADLVEAVGEDAAGRIEHTFIRAGCSEFIGALRALGWLKFPGES
jgi:hypothetical protein